MLDPRRLLGIDPGRESVTGETIFSNFFQLLEKYELGAQQSQSVGKCCQTQGMKIASVTIVDASIINVLSSTKHKEKSHNPEMHQIKKEDQWYIGMKAHIGVDSKIIPSVAIKHVFLLP